MNIKKSYKFIFLGILIALLLCLVLAIMPASAKSNYDNEAKRAVPFSEVDVNEGFLHDYIKLTICNVIPTAIDNVEKPNGGINNIKNCANWHRYGGNRPDHEGALYVDSDVHKVLESMCMALDTPSGGDQDIEAAQAKIKQKLEEWIPIYQWAPDQSDAPNQYAGYFDTYWSLDPNYTKYSNTDRHELYCQGHFIEAAVAHYRYSKNIQIEPDTRLLDVAINSADHISKTFGTDASQRKQIPGHEEIELSLLKLAKLCQEIGGKYGANADKYIKTAAFFLGVRGDYEGRTVDDTKGSKREYYQDHAKVEDQRKAVGHAVRAQYLYTGMCDLASIDSQYAAKYDQALKALWDDVTNKKQYVTGGIGDQRHSNEGFDDEYYLPNYGSYCETCAGVANMMWNRAMSTLYDGAKYADQIETDLYNNVLGHINFDGNKFYYQNRMATTNAYDRSQWYGTACCPPNFTRTILQLGGYIYNTTSNDIFINQYISNKANFLVGDNYANINMNSGFPYDSKGQITVKPQTAGTFNVHLRKPSWSDNYSIKINGVSYVPQEKDGYLVISGQTWVKDGTTIEFDFDMPLKYVRADERVEADKGQVSLRRGPIFYCAEGCDNDAKFDFNKAYVVPGGDYNFEYVKSLDGKDNPFGVRSVYVLNHAGKELNGFKTKDITWRFIPYYARCNRDLSGMRVFVHDYSQPIKTHQMAVPSASFTSKYDTISGINDGVQEPDVRWTSYKDEEVLKNPWVQYNFDTPISFKGFRIWWYEDNKGVRLPDNWSFKVYNKAENTWKDYDLNNTDQVKVINEDPYKTYIFTEIYKGDAIKLTMTNEKSQHAVGIVEWELVDEHGDLTKIDVAKKPVKTEYLVNEDFDPSGMVIKATYQDANANDATEEVNNFTWSPDKFTQSGIQNVTISYSYKDITKTTTLQVDVKDSVSPQPSGDGTDNNSGVPSTGDDWLKIFLLFVVLTASSLLILRLVSWSKNLHVDRH